MDLLTDELARNNCICITDFNGCVFGALLLLANQISQMR